MCNALLEQLKSDAKLAVKQALNANGPFELSPQASFRFTGHQVVRTAVPDSPDAC